MPLSPAINTDPIERIGQGIPQLFVFLEEFEAGQSGLQGSDRFEALHIDENREKHILQMDANALMITLRELEAALTAESDPKVRSSSGL